MALRRNIGNSMGDVSYGNEVLRNIIKLAAQEISEVSNISGKGIRTDIVADTISVDVYLDVYFDASCSHVAYKVQENIKRGIETMTDYKVNTVNVYILGVNFTKE